MSSFFYENCSSSDLIVREFLGNVDVEPSMAVGERVGLGISFRDGCIGLVGLGGLAGEGVFGGWLGMETTYILTG